MKLSVILKKISIKNSDTDTYVSLVFDINADDGRIDLNELYGMKLQKLEMELKKADG